MSAVLKVWRRDFGGWVESEVLLRNAAGVFVGGAICRYDTVMASWNDSNKFSVSP